ncbi:hypothetical protein HDV00_004915 [Rhizophlyctis rosea]|nr:hypothetical protein HDV00_004915 [Rhizophlyctis rosea]
MAATELTPPFLGSNTAPVFPNHTLTQPLQPSHQQHNLSKWQHRRGVGGFRRGLASDIILGDRSAFQAEERYLSTMHKDYHEHQLTGKDDAEHVESTLRLGDDIVPPTGPAGKPLGIPKPGAKTGTQLAFEGAGVRKDGDLVSITKTSYPRPDMEVFKEVNDLYPPRAQDSLTPAEKYHQKPPTATSAAHIGLRTRRDLPIDDSKFHNFTTTNQEAYIAKPLAPLNGGAINLARNRISNIPQGIRDQLNYTTTAGSAFGQYSDDAYRHTEAGSGGPGRGRKSNIVLSMGADAKEQMYTSTSAAAYKGDPVDPRNRHSFPGPTGSLRGKSSIAFGQQEDVNRATEPSVSQRDYVRDALADAEAREAVRSSIEDRLKSKKGIAKAIKPGGGKVADVESASHAAYQSPDALERACPGARGRTAGIRSLIGGEVEGKATGGTSFARLGNRVMNRSSVPDGDTKTYNFTGFETTTNKFFPAHWDAKMVPHPVLGANITRSNFTFGQPGDVGDVPDEERFRSSTQTAFVPHANAERTVVAHGRESTKHILDADGGSVYLMGNNRTTQQDHFKQPREPERRFGHAPPNATRKMLFPLKTVEGVRQQSYETMMDRFHGPKEGLWNMEGQPERKVVGARRKVRDSSIVLGDPKVDFEGKMHLGGGEQIPVVAS